MQQWVVTPESIQSYDNAPSTDLQNSLVWFECAIADFVEDKVVLQNFCNNQLQELHLYEIQNNSGQFYYDSTDHYELLILGDFSVSSNDNSIITTVALIIFENAIVSITKDMDLSGYVINARKNRTKKNLATKEVLLQLVFSKLEKNLSVVRSELNENLIVWRKILLANKITDASWGELSKLQDMMRKLALSTQQQYEVLEEWQAEQDNSYINFNSFNIHHHINQYYQAYLTIQTYENKIESLLNLHYIIQSHFANETLRVLTVVASIFLPLTFITGFFGMNFNTLPLQDAPWAAYFIAASMLVLGVYLYYLFKRRNWL